jgi:hypothetical protein
MIGGIRSALANARPIVTTGALAGTRSIATTGVLAKTGAHARAKTIAKIGLGVVGVFGFMDYNGLTGFKIKCKNFADIEYRDPRSNVNKCLDWNFESKIYGGIPVLDAFNKKKHTNNLAKIDIIVQCIESKRDLIALSRDKNSTYNLEQLTPNQIHFLFDAGIGFYDKPDNYVKICDTYAKYKSELLKKYGPGDYVDHELRRMVWSEHELPLFETTEYNYLSDEITALHRMIASRQYDFIGYGYIHYLSMMDMPEWRLFWDYYLLIRTIDNGFSYTKCIMGRNNDGRCDIEALYKRATDLPVYIVQDANGAYFHVKSLIRGILLKFNILTGIKEPKRKEELARHGYKCI